MIKKNKINIAILISGRGSNLQKIIKESKKKNYPAEIRIVISNRQNAKVLDFAKRNNISTLVISDFKYKNKNLFEKKISDALNKKNIDLICLAGFMKVLSAQFVKKWNKKVINIHPSLLPKFKGLSVHERVIKSRQKISGCTVHFVNKKVDSGLIIVQGKVRVKKNDNSEKLAKRILKLEHYCYPLAIKLLAEKKFQTKIKKSRKVKRNVSINRKFF